MEDISDKALEFGFDMVGKASPEPMFAWGREVKRRISEGLIPSEAWFLRNIEFMPDKLMPNAKQVLVLVRSYKPYAEPFPSGIATYSAHYREYPKGWKAAMSFAQWLRGMGINAFATSKLPLKALAVKTGIGVYRRNSLVYCHPFGSFVNLYGVVTDARITDDTSCAVIRQEASECGECDICIRQCPTGAIMPGGTIDLTKCIRNHMGSGNIVPLEIRNAYGVRLLGCEICQRVCPKNTHVLKDLSLPQDNELEIFLLRKLLELSQPSSREQLENIAGIIGRNYARRNRILGDAVIAAGAGKDPKLLKYLKETLTYPHVPVRAHSAWAIGRIRTSEARNILTKALHEERDPQVISEIKSAMAI